LNLTGFDEKQKKIKEANEKAKEAPSTTTS